jgi:hypothetical protein
MTTLDFTDGTLYLDQTRECALYAEYDNRLAQGLDVQVIDLGGFVVRIIKSPGTVPETLEVFDTLTGLTYSVEIPEYTTGAVCVPYTVAA